MNPETQVRTRFAPSPTGYLHIGNLRTTLYAYLWAKKNNGKFFLRIEDTDQGRKVPEAITNLIKTLNWTGLKPDEGIIDNKNGENIEKGDFGPYTQSERLKIYQKYAQKLVDDGFAYYCFCTPERLDKLRKDQEKKKQPTKYDGLCKNLTSEEVKERINKGEKYVIRMKVPENKIIEFSDLIRGKVKFSSQDVDEQVILKADGFPTYHLAHVVDDHLMETSLVIRGEEWLSSTPKHLLLFDYFNWQAPEYAHLSLILNPDKSKLSKRQGDVAVEDYKNKGYLPEALINYIALLGWNPGTEQEIFSLSELVNEFSFEKIHKAGAVFDLKKLDWFNAEYIKKLSLEKFIELAKPYLLEKYKNINENIDLVKILAIEQQRINKLNEVGEGIGFFFDNKLDYDPKLLIWKKSDLAKTKENLILVSEELNNLTDWNKENIEKFLINLIKDRGLSNGEVLWPLRVALTGLEKSPTPFEVAEILEKEEVLNRIKVSINKLN